MFGVARDGQSVTPNFLSDPCPLPVCAKLGFQFQKCSQLIIRSHNETLSVIAMRVCNPERSFVGINR
jgi:hypothetical protein